MIFLDFFWKYKLHFFEKCDITTSEVILDSGINCFNYREMFMDRKGMFVKMN